MVRGVRLCAGLVRWSRVLCLLLLFAQLALAAPHLSVTYDEPLYTAPGYVALTTGDFHWHGVIGHGPLVNMLAAWPLLLGEHRPDPRQISGWGTEDSLGYSRALLLALGDLETTAWVTRVPIMWLTVLLAACVARWAADLWGRRAAFLALLVFTFEPNLIAHGQLNTTDMGVTFFGFLGAYLLARYLRAPSLRWYVGAGLALGAALSSKTSGYFWLGAYGLVALLAWWGDPRRRQGQHASLRALGGWAVRLAGWIGIGLFTLWATYGFELQPLAAGGLPVPMASHWLGLGYQRGNVTLGQTTFLAGRLERGGHWAYFPLAFLLKTPLPLLGALLVSVGLKVRRPRIARWHLPLLVPPLAYLALSLVVGLNIGYRHLLPVLPFLCLWVGRLAAPGMWPGGPRKMWLMALPVFVWYAVGSVGVFPHYLAYFNELAGGPAGGYRYFVDSTLEWGQGFYALQDYLETQDVGEEEIHLAAFSSLDPAWYGLDFTPLPPTPGEDVPLGLERRFDPAPGRYVLSVTPLQGVWILDPDTYDWFRHRSPTARVGHVLWVYDVAPDPHPLDRVIQCADPLPPLDETALAEGFGRADLRSDPFDCERSWLYSGTGGWLVLSGSDPAEAWVAERLEGVPLVFRQREHWSHPATTLYAQRELPAGSVPPEISVMIAPSAWAPPVAQQEGRVVEAPVAVGEAFSFLGYALYADQTGLDFDTYWRVEQPPEEPISLMAHLLNIEGRPIAVDDGFGIPLTSLRSGDVFVQRHRLNYPAPPNGPYYVHGGAYWLETLEPLPMMIRENRVGDRFVIPSTFP